VGPLVTELIMAVKEEKARREEQVGMETTALPVSVLEVSGQPGVLRAARHPLVVPELPGLVAQEEQVEPVRAAV